MVNKIIRLDKYTERRKFEMKILEWKPFENIVAGTTLRYGGVSEGSLSS